MQSYACDMSMRVGMSSRTRILAVEPVRQLRLDSGLALQLQRQPNARDRPFEEHGFDCRCWQVDSDILCLDPQVESLETWQDTFLNLFDTARKQLD